MSERATIDGQMHVNDGQWKRTGTDYVDLY